MVMQQRFCHCGFSVWVEYQLHRRDCTTVFRSSQAPGSVHLTRCPCCGQRIHIDELR
jgi:hypothetical protein